MALKTYGTIAFDYVDRRFVISKADPHVCIKLKKIFPKIGTTSVVPFYFKDTPEICADLQWFLERYPLQISDSTKARLEDGKNTFHRNVNDIEAIFMPDYVPPVMQLKAGYVARDYQVRACETLMKVKRLLIGDDLGLGKTLSSILALSHAETLPAIVVVQTHMTKQWKEEGIELFTDLKCHIIKGTTPYSLPKADVYIMKYSCLAGWSNVYSSGFFKYAIFDECQEFRREASNRYEAGVLLSNSCEYVVGLSATPIYNFGDEIFNVLNLINPGCMGELTEFLREWCKGYGNKYIVAEPRALGSYLRENFLFLRRTRADVGRELPPVNKIVHTVDFDQKEVDKHYSLARQLAMKVVSGTFTERGAAARELDLLARQTTGISKAKYVCDYVKILLDNDQPVILAAWHRAVYDIYLQELEEYKPVMYTGTESPKVKDDAKSAFIDGKTKLFIISLRSGAGVDGLQKVCHDIVFGELDWSPKVQDQLIGRADRDGQEFQVTAHFLVSEEGSDPVMINMLGLKSSQSGGIVDPLAQPAEQFTDESRMKQLAQSYLNRKNNGN